MIKVSVIIPVYGVENYIERCLESVVNQTLEDIEIIIINDDTKDSSMKICNKYKEKDSRIKIYNKENEGLGLTRNYGLERASGEFVAFLDSDDFIDLDFYEKLYNSAIMNKTDACFTNYKVFKNGEIYIENRSNIPFDTEVISAKDVMYNMLKVPTKLSKKKFIGMSVWRAIYKNEIIKNKKIKFFSEREFISEDILFNIDFLDNAKNISFVKNTYYYYCENLNSLTHTYRKDRFEKNKKLHLKLVEKVKDMGIYDEVKKGIANSFIDRIRGCIKNEFYYNLSESNVKEILEDEEVQNAITEKTKEDIRKNIFDYFIKHKNIKMLQLCSGVRRKLKR